MLWWKNWWNCYDAEKRIVSKLSKILNLNFDRLDCKLCQNFTFLYSILSEKLAFNERHVRTGPGRVRIYALLVTICSISHRNDKKINSSTILHQKYLLENTLYECYFEKTVLAWKNFRWMLIWKKKTILAWKNFIWMLVWKNSFSLKKIWWILVWKNFIRMLVWWRIPIPD